MTIRLADLTVAPARAAYLNMDDVDGAIDALTVRTWDVDLLSVVRHIVRDERDVNQIPVIIAAFVTDTPNRWGHNMLVEVEYNTQGYRAIYAAHVADRVTNVQCYMD